MSYLSSSVVNFFMLCSMAVVVAAGIAAGLAAGSAVPPTLDELASDWIDPTANVSNDAMISGSA